MGFSPFAKEPEVAEMNYKMRNSFGAVPSCRYVSFEEILRSRTKAGAKQGGSINEIPINGWFINGKSIHKWMRTMRTGGTPMTSELPIFLVMYIHTLVWVFVWRLSTDNLGAMKSKHPRPEVLQSHKCIKGREKTDRKQT
jgi:hypothetical protein